MSRDVAFFVSPNFDILNLAGPLGAFQAANVVTRADPYRLHVVSHDGGAVGSTAGVAVMTAPIADRGYDTLLVIGGLGPRTTTLPAERIDELRANSAASRRTASVCTGAFVLAAAGLLNGRRATTHWRFAGSLQRRHPIIRVVPDAIFVRDGPIWSSAGITAGIDLALALIEDDLGLETARAVARELVVHHRRLGGQSQFSVMLDLEPRSDRIQQALVFAREHLHESLPIERLAEAAHLSPRQFGRIFRAETGETPARAIERLRVEEARSRVEQSLEPIESIARAVGFSDPERMRRAFLRTFGQPPQAMKRAARRSVS